MKNIYLRHKGSSFEETKTWNEVQQVVGKIESLFFHGEQNLSHSSSIGLSIWFVEIDEIANILHRNHH